MVSRFTYPLGSPFGVEPVIAASEAYQESKQDRFGNSE